jgi:hypothetical protein
LNVTDWFGGNEGPGGSLGNVTLVPGPNPTPLGTGSASLQVDYLGRASLGTNAYAGTRLDAFTDIDYWGYVVGGTTNQLVLQFDVDYNSTDADTSYQGRLTFVPGTNPPADQWRHLNALTDGTWFASQAPGNTVCNQATPCTWSQVLQAFPDAAVRNDSIQKGAFLFRLGGPIPGGAQAYVDDLTVGINGDTTTTDFEPGGTVTPTIGGLGTPVTLYAYGIKPKVKVTMYYPLNAGLGLKYKLCVGKANAEGVATCLGVIPSTAAKASPYGIHTIDISARSGGYRVDYYADFDLTPPATPPNIVRTLGVAGWFGANEGPGGSLGNTTLVLGPNPTPMGQGSAALEVDSAGMATLGTNGFAGTRLDAITDMDYWAYVVGGTTNQFGPQFDVDYDSTDVDSSYQGRLVFVPNDNPPADQWRHLNALTDGMWYATQDPGDTVCSQAQPCAWSQVVAAFPNAAVRNDSIQHGEFLFGYGGPIAGGALGYVDDLTVGIGGVNTTTDFEPGGTVTPTIGGLGTRVTFYAYGIKPNVSVSMYYPLNADNGKKLRLCSGKANAAGVATCSGHIPTTAKKAGPYGIHTIDISAKGGGATINYYVDYNLTP